MPETSDQTLSDSNIRTLVYFFGVMLDRKLARIFEKTPYEKLRASDSRVFVTATHGPKTISDIARHLHISRQSTQSSVSRLMSVGIVKLDQHPASKREKLVVITEQGWQASVMAIQQLKKIESELASTIGNVAYAALRQGLEKLVQNGSGA